ncbi:hypothetical protein BJ138DRAFT_1101784 [Hygrophoropsis aurantiaca]|uniref:Uncharacterized protein n=1 Tax=Hygrophoropsis aurantiaca TaxID=72124 RepID=A0ACB8ACN7_9AGAM|nr:hypothetical protein BJ138DRAFT_1101784 [Hygrophoropsis aurantiaca]
MHIRLPPIFACLLTATSVIACCFTPDEVKKHRWFPEPGLLQLAAWHKADCEGPMIEPYEETWNVDEGYRCILLPERFHKMASFDYRADAQIVWSLAGAKKGIHFTLHGDNNCSTSFGTTGERVWIEPDFAYKNKTVVAFSINDKFLPDGMPGWEWHLKQKSVLGAVVALSLTQTSYTCNTSFRQMLHLDGLNFTLARTPEKGPLRAQVNPWLLDTARMQMRTNGSAWQEPLEEVPLSVPSQTPALASAISALTRPHALEEAALFIPSQILALALGGIHALLRCYRRPGHAFRIRSKPDTS